MDSKYYDLIHVSIFLQLTPTGCFVILSISTQKWPDQNNWTLCMLGCRRFFQFALSKVKLFNCEKRIKLFFFVNYTFLITIRYVIKALGYLFLINLLLFFLFTFPSCVLISKSFLITFPFTVLKIRLVALWVDWKLVELSIAAKYLINYPWRKPSKLSSIHPL